MPGPQVSHVVVTRNRRQHLAGCLRSIAAQDYAPRETVVVDNGSSDGTPAMVRAEFPGVHLIALGNNQGVAGGRNRGVEAATGEVCIFLDDDARLADSAATHRAVACFQADPRLAVLTFRVTSAESGREDRKAIPRVDKRLLPGDYPCAYFCGTGFALRRSIFLELGMFWEPLVYGGEELEYSFRLLERGFRIRRTDAIEVQHHEAADPPESRPAGQYVYFNARNRCWIAARHLPWVCAAVMTLAWWAHTGLEGLRRRQMGAFVRAVADALVGLPRVLRDRRCIRVETLNRIRRLSGRWLY